jgi:hypothetical protein
MPWITAVRVMTVVYVIVVLSVAYFALPQPADDTHYAAARYLGRNTRLAESLFVAPRAASLEEWLRLARERAELAGKYVKQPIDKGADLTVDNVTTWPDVSDTEVSLMNISEEPDWRVLNQGTLVEIWIGESLKAQHVPVLAVVKSGAKWAILVQKSAAPYVAGLEDKATLRIEALPRKPADASPQRRQSETIIHAEYGQEE